MDLMNIKLDLLYKTALISDVELARFLYSRNVLCTVHRFFSIELGDYTNRDPRPLAIILLNTLLTGDRSQLIDGGTQFGDQNDRQKSEFSPLHLETDK